MIHDKEFKVIVDFAHTPHSLHVALPAIREQYMKNGGRLIHAFSCAAKRDETKRPIMGEESGNFADLTILTEEDYRDEDPLKINREIAVGLIKAGSREVKPEEFGTNNKTFTIIVERQKAVEKAVQIAKPGDVIVFTGKGHEESLCRGNTEYPWNDKKAIVKELEVRGLK